MSKSVSVALKTNRTGQTPRLSPKILERGKPGRPKGKHSDKKNYAQMSLYIRRDLRNRTKARLFEQGMEFSALVEGLLQGWLDKQEKR